MSIINSGRFEDAYPQGSLFGAWGGMPDGQGGIVDRYGIGWRKIGTFDLRTFHNPALDPPSGSGPSTEVYFREKVTLQNRHHPTLKTLGIAVNYNYTPPPVPFSQWPMYTFHVLQGSIEPEASSAYTYGSPVGPREGHPEDEAVHYYNFPFGVDPPVDGSTYVWAQFDGRLPNPLGVNPPDYPSSQPGSVFFPSGLNWGGGDPFVPEGLEDQVWVAGVASYALDPTTPGLPAVPNGSVDIFEWWAIDHMVPPAPEPSVLIAGAVRGGALVSEEA